MPPSVNDSPSGNQNQFFGTKVSIPGIDVNNAGDNQLILKDDYNTRIYYNNGVPNIVLGLRPNTSPAQYGLFISQGNIDATQATDGQLAFNSNRSFTVVLQGSYVFPSLGTVVSGSVTPSNTQVFAHNLGFIPDASVFAPFTVGGFTLPGLPNNFPQTTAFIPITSGALVYQSDLSYSQITWGVDTENLYIGQVFINDEAGSEITLPVTVYYTVFTLNATQTT